MNLIKITDLNVTYRIGYKTIFALKNINFEINSGEYICIIGSNGSGKSTLVKSLLGLIPAAHGKISINCKKDKISYLPQVNSIAFDFPATVEEIVISGTQNDHMKLPFYSSKNKEQAEHAMQKAEIIKLAKRRFGELSGGQQQRVLFARAITKDPKILILDEPCTGLDPVISESFYKLLHKINIENKTTIVMVSHDLSAVKKYASKIIVLNGSLQFYGSINEWERNRNGSDHL